MIKFGNSARKFLRKLDPRQFKQVVTKIIDLAKEPHPHDSEQLNGFVDFYRADIGEYRILYKIESETLNVPIVSKRNDSEVYKQLKRYNN